jgi:hypothetical protein
MKKQEIQINKAGKLFDVDLLDRSGDAFVYCVRVNEGIEHLVGNNSKKFESYLRKSFRNFYNLDKSLKTSKIKGRLSINKP